MGTKIEGYVILFLIAFAVICWVFLWNRGNTIAGTGSITHTYTPADMAFRISQDCADIEGPSGPIQRCDCVFRYIKVSGSQYYMHDFNVVSFPNETFDQCTYQLDGIEQTDTDCENIDVFFRNNNPYFVSLSEETTFDTVDATIEGRYIPDVYLLLFKCFLVGIIFLFAIVLWRRKHKNDK